MIEVVVTTGATRRALRFSESSAHATSALEFSLSLHSKRHHQQTNIQLFYRPDALSIAHPTVSEH